MKFSADQAVRVECVSCPEIYIGADMPLRWEGIEESDDRFYTHRGKCPQCSGANAETVDSAGAAIEDAERASIEADAPVLRGVGERRSCGLCVHIGHEGVDALPRYHTCNRGFTVAGLSYRPRVQPHHGTECQFFKGME